MNGTPPPVPEPKNSGLAIWSLVLGILSVTCFSVLCGIPAVICGHTAMSRIKRSAGALKGQGLALGGLITGYFSFVLIPVIGLLAAIAIPNFVMARDTAQRNACINNMRMIDSAKQQWALENQKEADALPTPADLDRYLKTGFAGLQCPKDGTYTINSLELKPTCSITGHGLPADASVQP